jgi:hypothetical protein
MRHHRSQVRSQRWGAGKILTWLSAVRSQTVVFVIVKAAETFRHQLKEGSDAIVATAGFSLPKGLIRECFYFVRIKRNLKLYALFLACLIQPTLFMGQDFSALSAVKVLQISKLSKPDDFNTDIYYKNKLEFSLETGTLPINIPLSSTSSWAATTRKSLFITHWFPSFLRSDGTGQAKRSLDSAWQYRSHAHPVPHGDSDRGLNHDMEPSILVCGVILSTAIGGLRRPSSCAGAPGSLTRRALRACRMRRDRISPSPSW